MIEWFELIGIIAGICTTSATLPQIIKVIKTKKTRDLATGLLLITIIGLLLWLVYGIIISSFSLILMNIIAISLWSVILGFKLKYK